MKEERNLALLTDDVSEAELLRQRVRAELEGGVTQAAAAKEIGISSSAISQYLGGVYQGSMSRITARLENWLDTRQERRLQATTLPALPAFTTTQVARRVLSALSYAQSTADLGVIYGAAGVGKTMAAREYAHQHSNVWLVTVTPATAALGAFLERIAGVCGVRLSSRRCATMETAIINRMTESGGLLIVDEAQHLKTRTVEEARALYDASGAGLVLMGNELVYSQMHGSVRSAAFAQLFSRIGKRVHLTSVPKSDAGVLLKKFGGCTRADTRAFLADIAGQPGALRGMLQVARLGCVLAGGREVGVEHLERAYLNLKKAA